MVKTYWQQEGKEWLMYSNRKWLGYLIRTVMNQAILTYPDGSKAAFGSITKAKAKAEKDFKRENK